jgi:hypothetical protein
MQGNDEVFRLRTRECCSESGPAGGLDVVRADNPPMPRSSESFAFCPNEARDHHTSLFTVAIILLTLVSAMSLSLFSSLLRASKKARTSVCLYDYLTRRAS